MGLQSQKPKSKKRKKKKRPKKGKGKGCRLKRGGPVTTQGIVLTAAIFVKWLRTSLTLYVFSCSTTLDKTSSCWKMFRNLQFFFWYIVYLFFDICYFSTAFLLPTLWVCVCVWVGVKKKMKWQSVWILITKRHLKLELPSHINLTWKLLV